MVAQLTGQIARRVDGGQVERWRCMFVGVRLA